MDIGERIRELRKANQLSRRELSEKSGVSETAIKQYETGKRSPKIEQLQKVAAALNTDVSYLLSGYTDPDSGASHTAGELLNGRIVIYEPVRVDDKTLTINVRVDNENMTAEELSMALIVLTEAAREHNISLVGLADLAAAAAAAISDKRKPSREDNT